jgi:hypothetical protein
MRNWVLIILLLVYPFQVALAVADKCCVTTPAGVTHHSAKQGPDRTTAEPVFVADDEFAALTDPHCPACTFGHSLHLPSELVILPAERHQMEAIAFIPPRPTSPPVPRLERPKWPTAAN